MRTVTRATFGLAAAALAVTGVAGAGSAAPTRATTHTLKLVAHQTASHNFKPNKFIGADTDRSAATGAVVGYDSIAGAFNFTTKTVKIDAALALKGGIITAHLTGKGHSQSGPITGGSGAYKGVTGTVQASGKGKVTHITITYTG